MTDVKRIGREEASAIRRLLADPEDKRPAALLDAGGVVWGPILFVDHATGKARCRLCGKPIPKDAEAISFGLDFSEGRGRLATAYLHFRPCEPEEG